MKNIQITSLNALKRMIISDLKKAPDRRKSSALNNGIALLQHVSRQNNWEPREKDFNQIILAAASSI